MPTLSTLNPEAWVDPRLNPRVNHIGLVAVPKTGIVAYEWGEAKGGVPNPVLSYAEGTIGIDSDGDRSKMISTDCLSEDSSVAREVANVDFRLGFSDDSEKVRFLLRRASSLLVKGWSRVGAKDTEIDRALTVLHMLSVSAGLRWSVPNSSAAVSTYEAVDLTDRMLLDTEVRREARTGITTAPDPSPARLKMGAG